MNKLSVKTDVLIKNLQSFGLEPDESKLYIFILRNKRITPLQASKNLKISRTRIYRMLGKLSKLGLIKEEIRDYGSKFIASPISSLNKIIDRKSSDLEVLKEKAPNLFNQLTMISAVSDNESKILHYRGQEGLEQVTWNSTKVDGEFSIYEINIMDTFLDKKFAEKTRLEYTKNPRNRFKQITNFTEFNDFTNVSRMIEIWEVRHIPKEILDIQFEILFYNDVTCMYEYIDDEIFIVEIYNQKLVDMQKQIFDIVWNTAKPLKILSKKGRAVLE